MHYYKFNIADWALSTSHLSLEEEAIYFRLINYYYDSEFPIPKETKPVLRRLRIDSEEKATEILLEFFKETPKGWVHARCEKILKEYKKNVKKNKENGAKGGRPRKQRDTEKPTGFPLGTQTKPKQNPNQEPLTTNHKPICDREKRKRFIPPSLDEVAICFFDKGVSDYQDQAERFCDFYESKGWLVGKSKMKSWKSAVNNWIKRRNDDESNKRNNQQRKTELASHTYDYAKATDF